MSVTIVGERAPKPYANPVECRHKRMNCELCKRKFGYSVDFLLKSLGAEDKVYKPDASQAGIVKALRAAGCSVEIISSPIGRAGIPDLLVGRKGVTYLLEVKNPDARGVRDNSEDLSDAQIDWHLAWRGRNVSVVTTPEEALTAVGAVK